MSLLKEFKDFALKGSALDMAVGIIIGAAFGTVVKSLVDDVIMPPVGMLLGGADFADLFITLKSGVTAGPYLSTAAAKAAGAVTLNIGLFINSCISFFLVASAVFLLVRSVNKLRVTLEGPALAEKKSCPFCFSEVDVKATRCPFCTSNLE